MLKDKNHLEDFNLVKELDDKSAALYFGGRLICTFRDSEIAQLKNYLAEVQICISTTTECNYCLSSIDAALNALNEVVENNCRWDDVFMF